MRKKPRWAGPTPTSTIQPQQQNKGLNMSTWHQRQNPVKLWHETDWSVVTDPPGGHLSVSRFPDDSEAQTYLNNLKKHGNGHGAYILPPMSASMRKSK